MLEHKEFKRDLIEFPKLKRVTVNGTRHYIKDGVPDCTPYPSVTSITSQQSKEAIKQWRKRVGEKKANAITAQATRRGTKAHLLIEQYIGGEKIEDSMPTEYELYKLFHETANKHIDNIRAIEGQMYSDYLRVAGTADCIAEYDGRLSIIDWKTSSKPKKEEWISGYYMQSAAYAVMFEENTKLPIDQIVIIIGCSTGELQIFKAKRDDWIHKFIELREVYDNLHNYRQNT